MSMKAPHFREEIQKKKSFDLFIFQLKWKNKIMIIRENVIHNYKYVSGLLLSLHYTLSRKHITIMCMYFVK